MEEEELELLDKYKRLSPSVRHIALAQIAAVVEFEENLHKQSCSLQASTAEQRIGNLDIRLM